MTKHLTIPREARVFDFRPPQWRPKEQLNTQFGTLLFLTLLWLSAFGTLAARVVATGGLVRWEVFLFLALLLSGAAILTAWQRVAARWTRRSQTTAWPALSRKGLQKLSPVEFEEYVAQRLFIRHGYKVENTQESRDGGVDLVVEDADGRRAIVQCKRYEGTVGAPAVRDLYGTVIHNDVDLGYLVTTGKISAAAREWAGGKPIILVDGDRLMRYSRAEPELSRNAARR